MSLLLTRRDGADASHAKAKGNNCWVSLYSINVLLHWSAASTIKLIPSALDLVVIAIILVRQEGSISSTCQVLLQTSITLRVDIAYQNVSKSDGHRLGSRYLPAPPKKLSAIGKKISACNAAQSTSASQTLK